MSVWISSLKSFYEEKLGLDFSETSEPFIRLYDFETDFIVECTKSSKFFWLTLSITEVFLLESAKLETA